MQSVNQALYIYMHIMQHVVFINHEWSGIQINYQSYFSFTQPTVYFYDKVYKKPF